MWLSTRRGAEVTGIALLLISTAAAPARADNSMFVPLTPCRVLDTRSPSPSPIMGGTTRSFNVVGVGDYSAQGGSATGCGIPGHTASGVPVVTALSMNVIAVTPSGRGNLIVYPSDVSAPTASTVNYPNFAVVPLNVNNGVIVPVSQSGDSDITLKPSQTTDVAIDVTGYFTPVPVRAEFFVETFAGKTFSGPNMISGHPSNFVTSGAIGATIAGGGYTVGATSVPNSVTGDFGTVAGGAENSGGSEGTVGGGFKNVASGQDATVPGGTENTASGRNSFAAGVKAKATSDGAIVFATPFADAGDSVSFAPNRFQVFASNGAAFDFSHTGGQSFVAFDVIGGEMISTSTGAFLSTGGAWTNASDRAGKRSLRPASSEAVLEKLAALPISTWSYKREGASIRHIGPMAQDFKKAFHLGSDDKHIATIDEEGVALAAIKGLYDELRNARAELKRRDATIAELAVRLATVEKRLAKPDSLASVR